MKIINARITTRSKMAKSLIYIAILYECVGMSFLYLWMLITRFSIYNTRKTVMFRFISSKHPMMLYWMSMSKKKTLRISSEGL